MKKVKSFEEFNQVNELSTGLVNNAALASRKRVMQSKKTDVLDIEKRYRQAANFSKYIDPSFKEKIKQMGFQIVKVDDTEMAVILGDIILNISAESYQLNKKTTTLSDNMLNRISRVVKLVQAELKNMLSARKEL